MAAAHHISSYHNLHLGYIRFLLIPCCRHIRKYDVNVVESISQNLKARIDIRPWKIAMSDGFSSIRFLGLDFRRALSLGFKVSGLGFVVLGPGFDFLCVGFKILVLGFTVLDLDCKVLDLGFEVLDLGFDAFGFKLRGFRFGLGLIFQKSFIFRVAISIRDYCLLEAFL